MVDYESGCNCVDRVDTVGKPCASAHICWTGRQNKRVLVLHSTNTQGYGYDQLLDLLYLRNWRDSDRDHIRRISAAHPAGSIVDKNRMNEVHDIL